MPRSLVDDGTFVETAIAKTLEVTGVSTVKSMVERTVVHPTRPRGEMQIDLFKGTLHYFPLEAQGNFQLNFVYSGASGGLSTILSPGQAISVAVAVTQGSTAYYLTNTTVEGGDVASTPKWRGANGGPSSGRANTVDIYTYTFIKNLTGDFQILGAANSTGGPAGGGGNTILYDFTAATFGTGGQTGPNGPSLATAIAGLSVSGSSAWVSNTSYFNMVTTGFQLWTVPATATYRIAVAGARGGYSNCWGRWGGNGAYMQGEFALTSGTVLKMVVGQQGTNNCYDGGGGGGTFVCLNDNTPLIIAGGGGGGSASGFSGSGGSWGTTNNTANSTSWGSGGSAGGGGGGSTAGGGGGLTGNGGGSWGGQSFTNGAVGGANANGGFGGGGGGGGTNGAGGGGGYSGGGYAPWSYDGAGGGSYNAGSNQNNSSNYQAGDGFITITKL